MLPSLATVRGHMAGDHIGELKKWATELARTGQTGEEVRWNRAVELISAQFSVLSHEVAILAVTPDDRFLRFVAPDNLRAVGRIPLSSTTALAVRTARERRPELINHF